MLMCCIILMLFNVNDIGNLGIFCSGIGKCYWLVKGGIIR